MNDSGIKQSSFLVVDDDEFSREFIVNVLKHIGVTHCHTAHDAETALRLAKQFRPDFVLLDIYMPEVDGWALLEKLRREAPSMVTLMITGSVRPEDFKKSLDKHVDGFCIKPVRADLLERSLIQARNSRRVTHEF